MTTLVEAEIDGEPLSEMDILSYAILLILAGNETTRNATSGGLLALIEHPEQFERLRREPALLDSAIEEILRWTSPVIHFARTVTRDVEMRGTLLREGQTLALWYPSANRDEDVFEKPDRVRYRPRAKRASGVRRLWGALSVWGRRWRVWSCGGFSGICWSGLRGFGWMGMWSVWVRG